jgi:hypothetical protein
METQQMAMPAEMAAPGPNPEGMAVFEQMRQEISPQEFSNEMLAGASQVDPQAVAEFTQELQGLDMPPEVLDALNDVVDEILANPEQYAQLREKYIAQDLPEDILPEQFDPEFFAALNMAIDQMVAAPTGVQAFAQGGIAELKPIAKAIASYGRNGDTMLAHITPAEARMLRRRGGSGTTNPDTGLPEFFLKKLFKGVSKALKSVGNAVKKFAKSSVGKLVTTVALGFFLGPAAASMLGVSSTAGVAAVSGFVGSAGSTLAGGGNLKDALKAGAIGGLTAGAGAGIMGGSGAFASGSYTGPTTIGGQFDKFKDAVGIGGAPNMAPVVDAPASVPGTFGQDPTAAVGPGTAPVPDASAFDATQGPGSLAKSAASGARSGVPTIGESFSKIGSGVGLGDGPANFADFKQGVGDLFAPGGPSSSEINARAAELVGKTPQLPFATAIKQATSELAPGMLRTYGPAALAGIGALSATGSFTAKPVQGGAITDSLNTSAADRMRRDGTQRENYMQNLPGVVYDDKGEPVFGKSTSFPKYTSPGFASAPGTGPGDIRIMPYEPPPVYTPPKNAMTNSPGGIAQPYNNSGMYSNFMPNMQARGYADGGGIAALGSGGYPRRTGQISGPGTEKSDSIPAMLSDGEFVMTASAVRGAGKGDRRAGAKRMYKLMHQLEKNSERG